MNLSPILTLVLVQAIGQSRGTASGDQGRALALALLVRPPILGLLLAVGLEQRSVVAPVKTLPSKGQQPSLSGPRALVDSEVRHDQVVKHH